VISSGVRSTWRAADLAGGRSGGRPIWRPARLVHSYQDKAATTLAYHALMTWTLPNPAPADGPLSGADRPILEGFLAWQRATLLGKCAGLTGEQLAERTAPPSNLALLGLIRHMAKVERIWFRQRFGAQQLAPMYDPALGKDADFEDLDPARAADDYDRLIAECALADEAAAAKSLDDTITVGGDVMSLRMVYVHMIAEYARHIGHADLIRERLDGATG
jgi:uncharacterized damage-inducible protein DinB